MKNLVLLVPRGYYHKIHEVHEEYLLAKAPDQSMTAMLFMFHSVWFTASR